MFIQTILVSMLMHSFSYIEPSVPQQSQTREYTRADFVNVEGANLNDKITRAVAQCKTAKPGDSCWLAWHFPVRESTRAGEFRGFYYRDDDGIKIERREDPKQTAVFLLTDVTGAQPVFKRVKTLNLGEPYVFENRPVYWLGDNDVTQSFTQLETIHRNAGTDATLARGALRAISYHDSPRAVGLLKDVASKTTNEEIRGTALSSLGNLKVADADNALIELFDQSVDETFKEQVIRRLGYSESKQALDKLQGIAQRDTSARLRKAAIRQLSRTANSPSVFDGDWNWSRGEE